MLPQRRRTSNGARPYFGNRDLVLIVVQAEVVVWMRAAAALARQALFERRGIHHDESILAGYHWLPNSIVNAVQGYPKVDRISDTTFKRYEFMRPSA
jgi:hypothetical protein